MPEEHHGPISLTYDPENIPWYFFKDLIRAATDRGQDQDICQNLVGASLHLAFPQTTDDPTYQVNGQPVPLGHFLVGDTVFHVIIAPVLEVYDKCRDNLEQNFRVWLLVTEKYFCGTRQNAEIILPGKITVSSIESFVAQNLERQAGYSGGRLKEALRLLLETYNARIKSRNLDQSLTILIPPNLAA